MSHTVTGKPGPATNRQRLSFGRGGRMERHLTSRPCITDRPEVKDAACGKRMAVSASACWRLDAAGGSHVASGYSPRALLLAAPAMAERVPETETDMVPVLADVGEERTDHEVLRDSDRWVRV